MKKDPKKIGLAIIGAGRVGLIRAELAARHPTVGWIGIAAPARTPAPVLDQLNAEIVRIINTPEMKERLATLAFTPVGDTREQFARFIKAEISKWGKAVKESGAKAE